MDSNAKTINSEFLIKDIASAIPPAEGFSAWFLGQNSFILKGADGFLVAIDPYLSDWCATRGKSGAPTPRSRLYPPPIPPSSLEVDLVLLTHSHCDHADPETLEALAGNQRIRVAGPYDAVAVARRAGFPEGRLTLLHPGQEERFPGEGASPGISVRTTFALPTDGSDLNHVGFLLSFPGGATFWDTGDTAWADGLADLAVAAVRRSLREGVAGPDVMAVCINAGYGNLSHWQASRLVGAAKPRFAVPTHWDLFPHNYCDPAPFRISLEKNAPGSVYAPMEQGRRYDYSPGTFTARG